MKIHVIHENEAWTAPLFDELRARGLPFENWHLDTGLIDPRATQPEGVLYNRMSASSHTRDHRFAPELTRHTLAWLEAHGRRTAVRGLDGELVEGILGNGVVYGGD